MFQPRNLLATRRLCFTGGNFPYDVRASIFTCFFTLISMFRDIFTIISIFFIVLSMLWETFRKFPEIFITISSSRAACEATLRNRDVVLRRQCVDVISERLKLQTSKLFKCRSEQTDRLGRIIGLTR
jgi:hypothetical protein